MESPRYTRDDVDAILLDSSVPGQRIGTVEVGELLLSKDARVDHARWDALMEGDRKFRLSWNRKRQDLRDTSASGYDLSIASLAVLAGWPDQEIANALICCRRKHGDDLKLRVDYYQRTIATAREELAHETAVNELEKLQQQPETADTSGDARAHLQALLRDALKVDVQQVIKYTNEDGIAEYELVVEGVSIRIGPVSGILEHARLEAKIADACGMVIPGYKGERWRIVTQALLRLADSRKMGSSTTERGDLQAWVQDYLHDNKPSPKKTEVVEARAPILIEGVAFIFLDQFQGWLGRARSVHLSTKEIGVRLRRCGMEPQTIYHRKNDKETTREVWPVPDQ